MGKIMRTSPWFAALCVSLATAAHAADGLELTLRTHGAAARVAALDAPVAPAPSFAGPASGAMSLENAIVHRTLPMQADLAWLVPACHGDATCGDAGEARLLYRGARRYMPAWQGMAAEGISLRRGRVVLRYSFR
jgi:hypothetical protein